jgi:hypothetical protein
MAVTTISEKKSDSAERSLELIEVLAALIIASLPKSSIFTERFY